MHHSLEWNVILDLIDQATPRALPRRVRRFATVGTTRGETAVGMIAGPPREAVVAQFTVGPDVPSP